MYTASCPLRVSLFGGSTDNPHFVEKYGRGSVISFTCNLKTYITLHEDSIGYNKEAHKYVINYSRREECETIDDIKNDPIRVVLKHFGLPPVCVSLMSDIYSQGSGLASSSSYIINLIKCVSMFKNLNLTDIEICHLAYDLEKQFNPYCGYQDPYGCGIGGFKKIDFERGGVVKYNFLQTQFFNECDMHLVFTGITRNSKNILKDVTDNLDKVEPMLDLVEQAYSYLSNNNYVKFLECLNDSWIQKKKTSRIITENQSIKEIDKNLNENKSVLAHKLCGAGNGGFFLVFSEKNRLKIPYTYAKIKISSQGVRGKNL